MVDDNASATRVGRRETVESSVAKMRIGSVNMHLAKKQKRKEFVYLIEHWVKADICGIVETWLKDNGGVNSRVERIRASMVREGSERETRRWHRVSREGGLTGEASQAE